MEILIQDLKLAFRSLRKSPGFTIIAVLTVALGIGANTAIFSVLSGVVLRPLPYEDADRIMVVWETRGENKQIPAAPANLRDWEARSEVFEHLAAVEPASFNLTGSGQPERLIGARTSTSLFGVTAARPLLGRTFVEGESEPGSERVVVLSHAYWQRSLGGDPAQVGKPLLLDGASYEIIGIMPEDFEFSFPAPFDLWVPRVFPEQEMSDRGRHERKVFSVGRLKSGVSVVQAQARLEVVAQQLAEAFPASNQGWGVNVVSLHEQLVGNVRPILRLLLGLVAFVLLIACVNLTHLMLARNASRSQEIALRLSLGASRGRLCRQLLTESALVAAIGGALGLFLAHLGARALVALSPKGLPRLDGVGLDPRVILFAVVLTLMVGFLVGLLPALRATAGQFFQALREGGRNAGDGSQNRVRNLLVVLESALALLLLIGAGLTLKSLHQLSTVDPGFQAAGRYSLSMVLPPTKYPEPALVSGFLQQSLERIEQLPAVRSATAVTTLPLTGANQRAYCFIDGRPVPEPGSEETAGFDGVAPGYFSTMGIPLVKGRTFGLQDSAESESVVVINETLAKRLWPDSDPIGSRISYFSAQGPWRTVVGVVGDIKYGGLGEDARSEMYHPFSQFPQPYMQIVVRTDAQDPEKLLPDLRNAIWSVDPDQPIAGQATLEEIVARSIAAPRFTMILMSIFALLALILGAVGIYGVVSHAVEQRSKEAGVRMALGAQRSDVLKLILRKGLTPVIIGILCGVVAAIFATRVLASRLFEVSPTDPGVFAGISILLALVGAVAAYIPARRATRVDPVVALRSD